MPDPNGRGVYRVQVGAFSNTNFAQESYNRLRAAGFNPAFEQYGNVYRVVISGVRAADMPLVAQRLGNAGFAEAWIRQEN
jgi:cell division septation protein DedD